MKNNYFENISRKARKLIIETIYNCGAGHPGGSLSAIDILTVLYTYTMNINPYNPNDEDRDRFVLSKGHVTPALYSILALRGYFKEEELNTFDKINSRLQAHPDMSLLPGLDFSTGSLGQGISGAVGMALGAKLLKKDFKVYCLVGDGETQEGSVWESINIATRYKLDNLVIIIDNNNLQQYGFNDENPITYPYSKFDSFGCNTVIIDGHNYSEIVQAFNEWYLDKPTVIIAKTIKGKGISFMENNKDYHSKILTKEEYDKAMEELN